MTAPIRIQRKRTPGWKMPENTVYVGRPSRWGNPLRIGQWKDYGAAEAVRDYRKWLERDGTVRSFENVYGKPPTREEIVKALRGKNLACWCPIGAPCHADVLFELANAPVEPSLAPADTITDEHLSAGLSIRPRETPRPPESPPASQRRGL